ncbi:MAG: VOC family protein [Pseudomonadales bacterium]
MHETHDTRNLLGSPVQIAYFVTDIERAARRMNARFGAGPFFVTRRIALARGEHRGRSCRFVHSSAYGQWGDIMLELVQQDEEGPSPFRDRFAPGQEGLHHLAFFVADLEAAIAACRADGLNLASRATTESGVEFAFVDDAALGHMLELYEGDSMLRGFYRLVREAADGWDGSDPIREL